MGSTDHTIQSAGAPHLEVALNSNGEQGRGL